MPHYLLFLETAAAGATKLFSALTLSNSLVFIYGSLQESYNFWGLRNALGDNGGSFKILLGFHSRKLTSNTYRGKHLMKMQGIF